MQAKAEHIEAYEYDLSNGPTNSEKDLVTVDYFPVRSQENVIYEMVFDETHIL